MLGDEYSNAGADVKIAIAEHFMNVLIDLRLIFRINDISDRPIFIVGIYCKTKILILQGVVYV